MRLQEEEENSNPKALGHYVHKHTFLSFFCVSVSVRAYNYLFACVSVWLSTDLGISSFLAMRASAKELGFFSSLPWDTLTPCAVRKV